MNRKEKELFEKKLTIKPELILRQLDLLRLRLPVDFAGKLVCMDFNTPLAAKLAKQGFPKADVAVMEHKRFENVFMLPGLYYKDEEERISMLKTIEDGKNLAVIANPPYGAIGANITANVKDNVDFDEYVNLLPANDYKRNKNKDLFNYQSDMEPINDGFADAAVTTHLAKISKTKTNTMTLDEFERNQYIDPQLDKYFAEQGTVERIKTNAHKYYFNGGILTEAKANKNDLISATTYLIGLRDINHHHLPYSKKIFNYEWNNSLELTTTDLLANVSHGKGMYNIGWITFGTKEEKEHFAQFSYSKNGFRFLCKLFVSMNIDGTVTYDKVFPKVDWTRTWTVEEILADYGYTPDEINEVMEDLKNYKGMDD